MKPYATMTGRVAQRTVSYVARVLGRPYADVRSELVAADVIIHRTPNAALSGTVSMRDLERIWPGQEWGKM